MNYCIFANGDVSIRFIGKDDNFVLELDFDRCVYVVNHHHMNLKGYEDKNLFFKIFCLPYC